MHTCYSCIVSTTGKLRVLYEAILGELGAGDKIAAALKARAPILKAFAKDQPSQLAALIAVEHFLAGEWEKGRAGVRWYAYRYREVLWVRLACAHWMSCCTFSIGITW
jgi:hypothetical protein